MIRLLFGIVLGVASLYLLSCSNSAPLAGGTDTETGGSTITALVVDNATGAPVPGAIVIVRKQNYLALDSLGLPKAQLNRANSATDASGYFSIDSLDTGTYFIEVVAQTKSALFVTPTLTKDTSINLTTGTLSAPIAVTGTVRQLGVPEAALVRAYGLERSVAAPANGSFAVLLPVGYRAALNAKLSGISISQSISATAANAAGMYVEIEKSSYSNDSAIIRHFLDASGLASLDVKSATKTDTLGRIRTLALRNRNLSMLPAEIGSLYFLWSIELDSNNFSTLPDSLASLRLLYNLSVKSNPLSQFPNMLLSMNALRLLDISSTGIATLPASFTNLSGLGVVWMNANGMTTFPTAVLSLPFLFNLSIKGNAIPQIPAAIGTCAKLEELDISNNKLTSLPAEIGSLTRLRILYAYGNQLTTLPIEIGTCAALEIINLNFNPLSALPSQIGVLYSLKALDAAFTGLSSLPAEVVNIHPIDGLSLEGNRLCTLPVNVETWVNQYSKPGWKATQQGCP